MKRTAIVGVGSPFGDDRAGWLVIEALAAANDEPTRAAAGVTLVALDRPGTVLLEHLRDVDRAVVIDALRGGAAPGTILRLDAGQLQADGRISSHGVGVAEALSLGAMLRMLPPQLALFAIAVGPDAESAVVSVRVRRAARRLAHCLQRWLENDRRMEPPWRIDCAPEAVADR